MELSQAKKTEIELDCKILELTSSRTMASMEAADKENGAAIAKQLHSIILELIWIGQVEYCRELESKLRTAQAELRFEKRNRENIEVIRENLRVEKLKRCEAEKWREKYDQLYIQLALLKQERAEWCL